MAELRQVTIEGLLSYLSLIKYQRNIGKAARDALVENKITNYQDLADVLKNGFSGDVPKAAIALLENELNRIKALLCSTDGLSVYEFTALEDAGLATATIQITNKTNKGNSLPIFNPAVLRKSGLDGLRKLSVDEIKRLLGQITERYDKNNTLANAIKIHTNRYVVLGVDDIAEAVRVFDRMVIEQSKEVVIAQTKVAKHKPIPVDLFSINLTQRRKIVEERIVDIAEALVATDTPFIWGELSAKQREIIMKSVTNPLVGDGKTIRDNLIGLSSKYLTMSEAKDERAPEILVKRLSRN